MKIRVYLSEEELSKLAIAHVSHKTGIAVPDGHCDFSYEGEDDECSIESPAIGMYVEFELNEETPVFRLFESSSEAA